MKPTLVFCRDPAAAVQILGLAADPEARRRVGAALGCGDVLADAVFVAKPPALDMLRRHGIEVRRYERLFGRERPAAVIEREGFGRVLTGTSDADETGDVELWRAARKLGLSSLALLDRADNFAARFVKDAGGPVLPDRLWVADETAQDACLAAGLPEELLMVGCDLRRAHVADLARRLPAGTAAATREAWHALDDDFCVLFASECGREAAAKGRPQRFDEIAALQGLIAWSGGEAFRRDVSGLRQGLIVIRPHPRDSDGKYDGWIGDRVRLDSIDRSAVPSLLAADLVVGLETSLLDEALWLGTPSLCLSTALMKDTAP